MIAEDWSIRLCIAANILIIISAQLPPLIQSEEKTEGANKQCRDTSGTCALGLKCSGGMTLEVPLQGITGPPGPPGPPGEAGPEGPRGTRGPSGYIGEAGLRGENGAPGYPGQPGEKGPKGNPGERGIQGEPGPKGSEGWQGEIGPPGPIGLPGRPGEKGQRGLSGEYGPNGIRGDPGRKGARGYAGDPGTPGMDGYPGSPALKDCKVAFQAGQNRFSKITSGFDDIVTFDTMVTNQGTAFKDSSQLVAPLDGTYIFYVTVSSNKTPGAGFKLQHNGQDVGSTVVFYKIRQISASNTFMLDLKVNDTVRLVVHPTLQNFADSMANSFAGLCLWRA